MRKKQQSRAAEVKGKAGAEEGGGDDNPYYSYFFCKTLNQGLNHGIFVCLI
jgi:hypothetical protein